MQILHTPTTTGEMPTKRKNKKRTMQQKREREENLKRLKQQATSTAADNGNTSPVSENEDTSSDDDEGDDSQGEATSNNNKSNAGTKQFPRGTIQPTQEELLQGTPPTHEHADIMATFYTKIMKTSKNNQKTIETIL